MRVRSPVVDAKSHGRSRNERGNTRLLIYGKIRGGLSPAPSFLDEPPKIEEQMFVNGENRCYSRCTRSL